MSFGSKGWNGNLKKLCSVQPPALIAAMPVGASMTCFFFVLADMYRRKVDLPVPAFSGQEKRATGIIDDLKSVLPLFVVCIKLHLGLLVRERHPLHE